MINTTKRKNVSELICSHCGVTYWKYVTPSRGSKYCSNACVGLAKKKVDDQPKKIASKEERAKKEREYHIRKQKITPYKNEYFKDEPKACGIKKYVYNDHLVILFNAQEISYNMGQDTVVGVMRSVRSLYEDGNILDYSVNMMNWDVEIRIHKDVELVDMIDKMGRVYGASTLGELHTSEVRIRDRRVVRKKSKLFSFPIDCSETDAIYEE